MQGIEQYLKRKFSLIPIKKGSKSPPLVNWKQYQYRRATTEEILNWYMRFGNDINIGLVTGRISRKAVIDVDDLNQLPELTKLVPGLWETTRVKTPTLGHYQFYFSTNGEKIRSIGRLFNLDGIELKAEGRYVVCPDSKINGISYKFEKSLTHILLIPKVISEEKVITGITGEIELPRVKARCVSQILNYDIPYHKRKLAYHIAYCKMRQEGHKKDYAIYVCKEANKKLSLPLTKKSDFDFGEVYPYGCPRINEELEFVDCSFCQVRGGLKVGSLAMRSFHKLKGLTNSQRAILLILDTYFKGLVGEELPTIYEIQKYSDTSIDYYTIKRALEVLKGKGIIEFPK